MLPDFFLSCDWGTSRFRLRLAEIETGQTLGQLAETTSAAGVAVIAANNAHATRPEAYRQTLVEGIAFLQQKCDFDLTKLPMVISGMASSSLGWCELPYAKLPFELSGENAVWKELASLGSAFEQTRVFLISGVCSDDDVMRGEETELLGAWRLAQREDFGPDGLVILPGTHSKHLEVRENTLIGIRTYMTGELFDVLGRHSVLRHSLPAKGGTDPATPVSAAGVDFSKLGGDFIAGVREGSCLPLSQVLFHVRTKSLLAVMSSVECEGYLSGLLIGAELMALSNGGQSSLPVMLCAGGELAIRYAAALESLELPQPVFCMPKEDVSRMAAVGQAVILKQILAI